MASFLGELQRRNVLTFAVAATATLVGWPLVQIAALAPPMFATLIWIPRAVSSPSILGFPPARISSWAEDSSIKRYVEEAEKQCLHNTL